MPDGTVADSIDPAEVDLSWDTFAEFWESQEGTAIEVTDRGKSLIVGPRRLQHIAATTQLNTD